MSYPYFRQQMHKVSFLEDCNFSAMLYPGRKAVVFILRWQKFSRFLKTGSIPSKFS